MQNIRARIHKRFRQLGTSYLRAPDADAEILASVVSESHAVLGAYCAFCLAPKARSLELNNAIVTRWLGAMPRLLELPRIFSRKEVTPSAIARLGEAALLQLYEAANQLALERYDLDSAQASEFANCLSEAASPCFAFHQRCMAPEKHTLENFASTLTSYLRDAVTYGAAASLLIGARRGAQ